MGLPRSTFYDVPAKKTDDAEIVAWITAICEEFECYGYGDTDIPGCPSDVRTGHVSDLALRDDGR